MNKKVVLISANLMIVAMLLAVSFPIASASTPTLTTGTTNGMDYTQYIGQLGGADYVLRIPETWNGKLIIACHGYSGSEDSTIFPPLPDSHLSFDWLALPFVAQGYAFASSSYGEAGWAVAGGVIRTHQLTEYLIDQYQVTGKVFLVGHSMGGQIALLLGEKYPELYSGVLDINGGTDGFTGYEYTEFWGTQSVATIRAALNLPLSMADANINFYKQFFTTVESDMISAYGGTPDQRPQAYEKYSPIYHANIQIPTITVAGQLDFIMPMQQHIAYQQAVADAGRSDLYKLYTVPMGQHGNAVTFGQVPAYLTELIVWSDTFS